jgi:hypothetical protein
MVFTGDEQLMMAGWQEPHVLLKAMVRRRRFAGQDQAGIQGIKLKVCRRSTGQTWVLGLRPQETRASVDQVALLRLF